MSPGHLLSPLPRPRPHSHDETGTAPILPPAGASQVTPLTLLPLASYHPSCLLLPDPWIIPRTLSIPYVSPPSPLVPLMCIPLPIPEQHANMLRSLQQGGPNRPWLAMQLPL